MPTPPLAAACRRLPPALPVILLISFGLNTWGITWGLPERWHPDELTQRAENMVGGPTLNPHYFAYGSFHYYLIGAFAVLPVKVPNRMLGLMDYDTQSTVVVTLSRLLSALMGTGVVFLTFVIGQRLFDQRTGLFAAALLAVSMLLVNLSHFATADVPSLFGFTLTCATATAIYRDGARRSYLWAGVFAGLAAAVKYVGGLALAVIVTAHLLRQPRRHRFLALACAAAAMGFVLGNPVLLFAPLEFAEGFVAESVFNSLRGQGLPRAFGPLLAQLDDAVGMPLALLSVAGAAYAVRLLASGRDRAATLLVLSMLLPYYLVIGSMRGPRAGPSLGPLPPLRYVLPMLPFLLLLAAKMLTDLAATRHRVLRAGALAVLAVTLVYSASYTLAADLTFTNDSRYTAREWILENVEAGRTIETTSYGPSIPSSKYNVVERPHDSGIATVAEAVRQDHRYLGFQTAMARLRPWLEAIGMRGAYVPWYDKALARHEEEAAAFDGSIQGLESRAPDVLVVSDLYTVRFQDNSSPEAAFFDDLRSGKSAYRQVAEFQYQLPAWLNPPAEFVNPRISIYARSEGDGR
jgi:hypothetical protein